MPNARSYLFLAVGGIAGVLLRYQLSLWISNWHSSDFPWATFLINVAGSFVLGFVMRFCLNSIVPLDVRLLLTTGFCGGFTTLSTFSYEFMRLVMARELGVAALYMSSTMVVSPLACFGGFALAAVFI